MGDRKKKLASEGGAGVLRTGKGRPVLRVSSFEKKERKVREGAFEDTFAKALLAAGYPSEHMNMRDAGWPDRYVVGGIWIELKVIDVLGIRTELEKEQKIRLNLLHQMGDRTFYCAKFEHSIILKPWPLIRATEKLCDVERYAYRTREDLERAIHHELD